MAAATPRKTAKQSRHVSGLESHLGFWLRFVSNHVSGEFKRLVEARGVSVSEWVALRQLHDDGSSTAATLMQALGMTKGAISKVITRLEAKQLIERIWLEDDRRAQALALTAAGRQLVPKLTALADQNDARCFGHLADSDKQLLTRLLQDYVRRHQLKNIPVD